LHLRHRHKNTTPNVAFVQINVVMQGLEPKGMMGLYWMVRGLSWEVERLTSEVVRLISEVEEAEPSEPFTLSPGYNKQISTADH
jgi:hypothetical protein